MRQFSGAESTPMLKNKLLSHGDTTWIFVSYGWIQILKSSALSFSRESSLMGCIQKSIESPAFSFNFIFAKFGNRPVSWHLVTLRPVRDNSSSRSEFFPILNLRRHVSTIT